MGTIFTLVAGLALAGITTFGLVASLTDNPSGKADSTAITYDQGQ